jgi:NADH-ubiquinone oxidoreductase chain 4
MLLTSLLLTPILGVLAILVNRENGISLTNIKIIALSTSILNFFISLVIFILFDFSTNQFQFVQEYHEISYFDFYLGVDGLSIYFILLTTIIIPISLLSNWKSISKDVEAYIMIILLLESLLLAVFLVLDILLFYIFFESILPPLFILIGIFGSDNRVKASFYLFLYTLLGSLFLLLSILAMSSIMSTTDFDTLFKGNFVYITQLFLFYGIFIAFAVKTPTMFLNTWLLKAHVESPLGGSIILAAIVLKLSLYGILRLILPILPKAYMEYTYIIFLIGVITIVYASLSTLRTIDIKELIAYSSVSHAAVYLLGVFSNSIQGIEGAITLGLAHGFVSPGLFICAGGVLYDRSHTRVISFYRGVTQVMPLFAILFFILCLANCGAPLTLNFIGEFLSLYGVFERSSLYGLFASSSIIFSAAYTIYMFQRIAFGGAYSRMFTVVMPDLTKREYTILMILVVPTVLLGIYPASILDGLGYAVSTLLYNSDAIAEFSAGSFSQLSEKVDKFDEKISEISSIKDLREKSCDNIDLLNKQVEEERAMILQEKNELTSELKEAVTKDASLKDDVEEKLQIVKDACTVAVQELDAAAEEAREMIEDGHGSLVDEGLLLVVGTDIFVLPLFSAFYKLYKLNFFSVAYTIICQKK